MWGSELLRLGSRLPHLGIHAARLGVRNCLQTVAPTEDIPVARPLPLFQIVVVGLAVQVLATHTQSLGGSQHQRQIYLVAAQTTVVRQPCCFLNLKQWVADT